MTKIKIEKPTEQKLITMNVKNWTPWECDESIFDWEYDCDETCYILEVKVMTHDDEVEINKGDLVRFPKGLKCKWHVIEKISKVYKFD